jgi:tetratricopeptide (TPR) repeat protein
MYSVHAETGGNQPYAVEAVEHFNKAIDLANEGRPKQAIAQYKNAIDADGRMEEAYSNLGVLYCDLQEYDLAIEAFTQALSIKPGRTKTLNALASTLYTVGRVQEAKEAWGRTIGIDPKCASAIYNLGRAFENENDYPGALVAYSRVLRLDPELADVRERLAEIGKRSNITDIQAFVAQMNQESAAEANPEPVQQQEQVAEVVSTPQDFVPYTNQEDSFQHASSIPVALESYDNAPVTSQSVEFSTEVSMSQARRQFSSAINRSMVSQNQKVSAAPKTPIRIAAAMKPAPDAAAASADRDFAMFIHAPASTH